MADGAGPKMSRKAPKRANGQGTGHLTNPAAFSGKAPQGAGATKHSPLGHPKRGGKSHTKGK